MDRPPDHYAVLGVPADADNETIRVAYRNRLRVTHPDTATTEEEAAEFSDVVEAGEVLLSRDRRAKYDAEVARWWNVRTSAGGRPTAETAGYSEMDDGSRFDPSLLVLGALLAVVGVAIWLWFPNRGSENAEGLATVSPTESVVVATEEPEPTPEPTEAPTTAPEPTVPEAVTPQPVAAATTEDDAVDTGDDAVDTEDDAVDTEDDAVDTGEGEDDTDNDGVATGGSRRGSDASSSSLTDSEFPPLPVSTGPLEELGTRGAIYRPPDLYLVGPVPSQEWAEQSIGVAISTVGADNVVVEYVIHPDASDDPTASVRIEQAAKFSTGSAEILAEFEPTLALGIGAMQLFPAATMIIEGHTDSTGTESVNLALSQARADAIVNWLVERGVERSRLTAVGRGESLPVATNDTAEGRALNRRIEVDILDFLPTG